MNWSYKFPDPIPLPNGGELRSLADVGAYILGLSKVEQERQEWFDAADYLVRAGNNTVAWAFFVRGAVCLAIYGIAETPQRPDLKRRQENAKAAPAAAAGQGSKLRP